MKELDRTLAIARRDWPGGLPAGFADGVMERIAWAARERPLVIATGSGLAMTALLALVAAALLSWKTMAPGEEERPPSSEMFGASHCFLPRTDR